ncbi:hypothetical protein XBKQ1_850036 [Xenorhabdus bovienii str. kraussei Quebec]|uniref:Uncharacterized protein n=2 Tax=Xenorhabdus bovienii TaxID=40576 RepID=A0A077PQ66_XENBV|nr:hypothetical protein XBKQ1_850036 [Xenorhabdus bovienii str. kraussei Quebec]CDH31108.1 hypothetical protein XBI1_1260129 [Xenorhabdus bovienii str. Intermedium]
MFLEHACRVQYYPWFSISEDKNENDTAAEAMTQS